MNPHDTTAEDGTPMDVRPVELLQNLIRFDTTNPPGNEAACIAYARDILAEAGFETSILARDEARPNLVTHLPGRGDASPLLMYGHVDVVTTQNQAWTHPPFEGTVAEGCVWGRGALDMKGGIAMMMAAIVRARVAGLSPPGDVILALVSDEEASGVDGARYLVENHAHLFEGVRFAIGEFGGFSTRIGGCKIYPVMIAEKQACWIVATVRGQGGHGAMPVHGQAMAKLARLLQKLDRHRLPVHVTPPARQMIEGIASALPPLQRFIMGQLLNPTLTNRVLDLLGPLGRPLDPLLHNTVSPTMLHASDKCNVIPSEVTVELDGRLLPGYTPDDLEAELGQLLGDEVEFSVFFHEPGPPEADMGLFDTLSDILRELDPEGTPVPLLLSAVTDARLFARLGIQTYGFTPMKLSPGFDFWNFIHAADERIPIEALEFGADAIFRLLQRFGEASR